MKFKLIAFFLILSIASWAQTATPAPSTPEKATPETKCSCCDKTATGTSSASHKHTDACMHTKSSTKDGKEVASCCSGKEEASCCKGNDGKSCAKTAASAGCCDEKCSTAAGTKGCSDHKDCCAGKATKQTAHTCCGSQCMNGQSQPTPGNE